MHPYQDGPTEAMIARQTDEQIRSLGARAALLALLQSEDDRHYRLRCGALRDAVEYRLRFAGANGPLHDDLLLALLVARRELRALALNVELSSFRTLVEGLSIANRLDAIESAVIAPDRASGRDSFLRMRTLDPEFPKPGIPASSQCNTPRSRECITLAGDGDPRDDDPAPACVHGVRHGPCAPCATTAQLARRSA